MKRYTFTMDLTVTDRALLIHLARNKAEESGCSRTVVKTSKDAIRWLLDSPDVFQGSVDIEDSCCEASNLSRYAVHV